MHSKAVYLHFLSLCLVLVITSSKAQRQKGIKTDRVGRILSPFQIVTFPNDPCIGGTKNGTCYTAQECSNLGGSDSGSCADGFGVCCIFSINCGESSSQNCTYFDSNAVVAGGCSTTICPCGDNICQLRLDFQAFEIAGPSTSTVSVTATKNGNPSVSATALQSLATQCLTDSFSVTNPNGAAPPTICGTNTGEHMYVDSSKSCNTLIFQLGNTPIGINNIPTRSWSIKVTQYSCDFTNLAPQGCTQYYFGSAAGTFQSYNYNNGGGLHLANQKQSICFRRETTFCRICYWATAPTDFDVSGKVMATSKKLGTITYKNTASICCGYTASAKASNELSVGYDCLQIPGAVMGMPTKTTGGTVNQMVPSAFCGNNGLSTTGSPQTVCSTRPPFVVNFRTDAFEAATTVDESEVTGQDPGFILNYSMDSINCNTGAQINSG